uniref:U6 snRNA-associated Sm-like protein LSm8 n=1 Tax=Steinernema glaseri TaxID=37863 RepID=A0A1I7ZZ36_9BILA
MSLFDQDSDLNMSAALEQFIDRTVSIIAGDGRILVGLMKGFDQLVNVILENAVERVYSKEHGIQQFPLGLYIVRGDNVAVIGEIDEEMDTRIDFEKIKAKPLEAIWIPQ